MAPKRSHLLREANEHTQSVFFIFLFLPSDVLLHTLVSYSGSIIRSKSLEDRLRGLFIVASHAPRSTLADDLQPWVPDRSWEICAGQEDILRCPLGFQPQRVDTNFLPLGMRVFLFLFFEKVNNGNLPNILKSENLTTSNSTHIAVDGTKLF